MSELTFRRIGMVLLVVLALWGALALTHRVREDREARFTLPRIDTGAVDSIALDRRGDSATLARSPHGGGGWTVNGHVADPAYVNDLLRAMVDTSAWGELVAESRRSQAGLGVDADSGRRVRVFSHGKTELDVVTGTRTSDYGGIYIRRSPDSAVYALHGSGFADPFTRSAEDWRDKSIAHVVPDSVFGVEIRRGTSSVELRRDSTRWFVGEGGATDSSAVANWLDAFRDLSASGFATPAQADSAHVAKPRAVVTLRGKQGASLLSLSLDSTAAGVWARADSGRAVFRLDPSQLSQLAPPESTFRAKKKPG